MATNKVKVTETENTKMFRSRFDIFVLNALNDKECEGYGYDVVNYIQTKTKGHYKIKTFSTIYNTLKRLEEQGLVVSHIGGDESNGATRRYYTLTEEGKKFLEQDKKEYVYLRTLLDNLLTDEDFDLDRDEVPYSASVLKPLTKRNSQASNALDDANAGVSDEETSRFDEVDDDTPPIAATTSNAQTVTPTIDFVNTTQTQSASGAQKPSANNAKPLSGNNEPPIPPRQPEPPKPKARKYNNDYKAVFTRITKPVFEGGADSAGNNNSDTRVANSNASTATAKNVANSTAVKNGVSEAAATVQSEVSPSSTVTVSTNDTIESFKSSLRNEGYSLNMTTSEVTSENGRKKTRFVFFNRIMRDSVVLTTLYTIITLLIVFLCKKQFAVKNEILFVIGGLSLAVSLIFAAIWFKSPDARKKDIVKLPLLNLCCVGVFLVITVITLITNVLNGISLASPIVYSPLIIGSAVVFYGVIFSILYKTENYFQK